MPIENRHSHDDLRSHYDVIVLGGGAAGLMAALTAGQRGRRVLILEVSNKLGKKILMSGGGRCNFTNLFIEADNFLCDNPSFVKSALSQYTQWDFIALVTEHSIAYHEKAEGQLFCDKSAKDILTMLVTECARADVSIELKCEVQAVDVDKSYVLSTSNGDFSCESLVVATGGLSIPTLGGATGLGYRLAEQFGLSVSERVPSLVPMTLTGQWHDFSKALAGVSVPVIASVPNRGFAADLLFTHRGISGPAILQLSNYWNLGERIVIDFLPGQQFSETLLALKSTNQHITISASLTNMLPKSLLKALQNALWPIYTATSVLEIKSRELERIAKQLHSWELTPSGTEGYRTAEVTRGGVDVSQISSKTMQVNGVKGLFFIGEVLDVTGHLGGFNFQWAWSSGYVAGMNV